MPLVPLFIPLHPPLRGIDPKARLVVKARRFGHTPFQTPCKQVDTSRSTIKDLARNAPHVSSNHEKHAQNRLHGNNRLKRMPFQVPTDEIFVSRMIYGRKNRTRNTSREKLAMKVPISGKYQQRAHAAPIFRHPARQINSRKCRKKNPSRFSAFLRVFLMRPKGVPLSDALITR